MKRFSRLAFAVIVAVALLKGAGASSAPGGFTYIRIDYPDSAWTGAFGINARGVIVGQYYDIGAGTYYAFLRTREGDFSTILEPGGPPLYVAYSINARGDIVGDCVTSDGACLLRNGVLTLICSPGNQCTKNPAFGINQQGDIVGGYWVEGILHGYLLHDGVATTIDYPGGSNTSARGINARGDIVGSHSGHGAFLLRDGQFTDIGFPNAWGTEALDINDLGDIVGDYTSDGWWTAHAFLLRNGRFVTLVLPDDLHPGDYTSASGINNRGEIVGNYRDTNGKWHGFLAIPR